MANKTALKCIVWGLTGTGLIMSAVAYSTLFFREYSIAFSLILGAILFDELDGYLARLFGVTTKFGAWLDSVADIITFLLFPITFWHQKFHPAPVLLVLLFVAGAFRLFRHAIWGYQIRKDGLAFVGVPSSSIHVLLGLCLAFPMPTIILEILLALLSIAMVSSFRIPKPPIIYPLVGLALYVAIVIHRSAVGF